MPDILITVLVLVALVLVAALAIRSMWKSHKSGGCCGGDCSACGGCHGSCRGK